MTTTTTASSRTRIRFHNCGNCGGWHCLGRYWIITTITCIAVFVTILFLLSVRYDSESCHEHGYRHDCDTATTTMILKTPLHVSSFLVVTIPSSPRLRQRRSYPGPAAFGSLNVRNNRFSLVLSNHHHHHRYGITANNNNNNNTGDNGDKDESIIMTTWKNDDSNINSNKTDIRKDEANHERDEIIFLTASMDRMRRNIEQHSTSSTSSTGRTQRWLVQQGLQILNPQSRLSSLQNHSSPMVNYFSHNSRNGTTTAVASSEIVWRKTSSRTRVPGCIAAVYIETTLVCYNLCSRNNYDSNTKESVVMIESIQGTSDALLSRGLLSVLVQTLQGQSAAAVLSPAFLDPESFTDQLGLRNILSPGRNDGLASMLRTVQIHIRELVQQLPQTSTQRRWTHSPQLDHIKYKQKKTISTSSPPQQQRQPPARNRVALLLSGGVDSAVALHLLLRQGFDVTCYYLKIWLSDEQSHLGTCPWEEDYRTCQQVCQHANTRFFGATAHNQSDDYVQLHALSLQQEYHDRVIQESMQQAALGRTPNPDILCNSRIKFGCFLDAFLHFHDAGDERHYYDFIASGHYAQVIRNDDDASSRSGSITRLLRAHDPVKDQSYFLCALSQVQLSKLLFPVGHLLKSQVRQLADQFQLPNRDRRDSQGLCFLGKLRFDDFLWSYLGERPGPIIDAANGKHLGTHRGVWYHTIGQRKGIGLYLNPLSTSRGPWYVVAKDPKNDIVYCSNTYDEYVFAESRSRVIVESIHWLAGEPPPPPVTDGHAITSYHEALTHSPQFNLTFKVRHGPKLVNGTLTLLSNTTDNDYRDDNYHQSTGEIRLEDKDSGLAPGQYMVFYQGEECLGSGVISERHWARFLSADYLHFPPSATDTTHGMKALMSTSEFI